VPSDAVRRRRPFARALLVSLAVHAAVLWVLLWLARPVTPSPRPPMRISILHLPPLRRTPTPPAPKTVQRPHTPPREGGPPTAPSTAAASPPQAPSAPRSAVPSDAPVQLFPPGAVARGAGPATPAGTGAQTGPDVPESRSVEGARVLERVETWRRESLAERNVAVGVDDYFKEYRQALQAGMGQPPAGGGPKHGDPTPGQRWIQSWLDALAEADPSKPEPARGERMPDRDVQDVSMRMTDLIVNHLGPMAAQPSPVAQHLLRRVVAQTPVAVLRIVQRPDGTIASTTLVASSGDKKFDDYVLGHAQLALAAVPRPPARQGAGLHPDGTRTDWAFFRAGSGCGVVLLRVY
jgi:hypothetical protein